MLSNPAAFPFFSFLIASLTSALEMGFIFTGSCELVGALHRHIMGEIFPNSLLSRCGGIKTPV